MADAEITRDELIDRIATAVEPDQRIRALFLAGSLGSGTADRFSDVDLLAIAARESHEPLAEAWRELLGRIVPVVYFNRLPAPVPILNAISSGWLRCDLLIADLDVPLGDFAGKVIKTPDIGARFCHALDFDGAVGSR